MEHAAQPVREAKARTSRNPARSGTRKMDLAQTIREAQRPLVERLGGVEHRLDRLETRFDRSEERWEAWRTLSDARWVDMGKEIARRYEKLDEKIDREVNALRRDFSAQLSVLREELGEHRQETTAGFARADAQYSDLRQEMLAGFAEMRERIERAQRNTIIMVTSVAALFLTWLELRDAALALFGG